MIPIAAVPPWVFVRTRRLVPLILAHWMADAYAVATAVLLPILKG